MTIKKLEPGSDRLSGIYDAMKKVLIAENDYKLLKEHSTEEIQI